MTSILLRNESGLAILHLINKCPTCVNIANKIKMTSILLRNESVMAILHLINKYPTCVNIVT